MANVLINDSFLTDIADAIRAKLDVTTKYKPADMPFAIGAIASNTGNAFTDMFTDYATTEKDITASDQDVSEILKTQPFYVYNSDNPYYNYVRSINSITFPETGVDSEVIAPTSMEYFFYQSPVKEINLNGLNVVNTTTMYCMCNKCTNLEKFNFGTTNLNKITNLYGAFQECTNLVDVITINPSLNTNALTSISYMFAKCSSLRYMDLSFLDLTKVNYTEGTFSNCTNLISATFPSTTVNLRNGSGNANSSAIFYGCESLQSLTIKATTPPLLSGSCLFGTNGGYNNKMKIFVPHGCGDTYKTAQYQSAYADIIEEM